MPESQNDNKKELQIPGKRDRDALRWLLNNERVAYKDSQQTGRPRRGITWFSVDSMGHIGGFNSRESGHIPVEVFKNGVAEHLRLFEHFYRPSEKEMSGDDTVDFPLLGLFVYEIVRYLDLDGYTRVGEPKHPARIGEIPLDIRKLIERVRYDGDFRDTKRLWVKKHWKAFV